MRTIVLKRKPKEHKKVLYQILHSLGDHCLIVDKEGHVIERIPHDVQEGNIPFLSREKIQDLFPDKIANDLLAVIENVITTKRSDFFESTLVTTDKDLTYKVYIVLFQHNKAICLFHDITNCMLKEDKISEQNKYLQLLHDTAIDIMANVSLKERYVAILDKVTRFIDTDHGFIALWEPTRQEYIIAHAIGSHTQHIGLPLGHPLLDDELEKGEIKYCQRPSIPTHSEHPDVSWVKSYALIPLHFNKQLIGLIGISFVTEGERIGREEMEWLEGVGRLSSIAVNNACLYERLQVELNRVKRMEEENRLSEKKQRAIINVLPDLFMLIHRNGIVADCKIPEGFPTMLTENYCKGKHYLKILEDFKMTNHKEIFDEAITKGKPILLHYDIFVGEKHCQREGRLIPDGDAVVLSIRDITDQRNNEERLRRYQKMEAVGTLTGGIAHEFNNMLAIITGFTELNLEMVPAGTVLHDNNKKIMATCLRAKDLIQRMLTFSRQTDAKRELVRLSNMVKETMEFVRMILPTNISVRIKLDQSGDDFVWVDPVQIHQLIVNLCANAEHAMRKQGGELTIALQIIEHRHNDASRIEVPPGEYVKLSISDTGSGIDHTIKERIFDPFFTTKRSGEGSGMGLAVVHGIVAEHGGAITVESHHGLGASFHVFFPRVSGNNRLDGVMSVSEYEREIAGKKKKGAVLFVDDEELIVDYGVKMLETLGYAVTPTTSAREALQLFRIDPYKYDAVVTDQTMPDITGDKLSCELLKIRPDVPIVLCTGFSYSVNEMRANSLGIKAFLEKPLLKNELETVLNKLLTAREA
ncbi:response regulator [Heliobacterium gestii]|uniref:Stage 0 sporulation protein A homolog n=1 Tax=Heliomicrobium gestii TaxID=2699 RepID=A0A845LD19_HELGE|nr:sensor histidine kinase [Heliomicrobium gestii]MBM7867925.1 signal transduction histidine kinase/CheY-like chemotaxis protein/PAS domain-containing protein [Heliomicrobium gestii]MZP43264.1 response regulator [Heliomicrobium gestii]